MPIPYSVRRSDIGLISLKNRYPFRIGTTSFIHPADYYTNAKRLAEYIDEIELLFFESQATSLPSQKEIDQLMQLKNSTSISYNIHLPIDLDITQPDPIQREKAALRYAEIVEFTIPLAPSTYTLHLKCDLAQQSGASLGEWQQQAQSGVQSMLTACKCPAQSISIETLDYPFDWFSPIVENLGLSVCVDVGHIVLYGYDLETAFNYFNKNISILHLHGVSQGIDHRSLQCLDETTQSRIRNFLSTFTGTASIEVFSYDALDSSMPKFAGLMSSGPHKTSVGNSINKLP